MLMLMKYEFRKALISKVIILTVLAVFEISFLFGIFINNDSLIAISNGMVKLTSTLGMFYMAFETGISFGRDIGKKQGYLLFMTPNRTATILGAKVLTGMFQLMILFSLVAYFINLNVSMLAGVETIEIIQEIGFFNIFRNVGYAFPEYLANLAIILFVWVDLTTLAFFVISISYTITSNGALNRFLSFILFFAVFMIETIIVGSLIIPLLKDINPINVSFFLVIGVIYLIPAIVNYICAAFLLDKRVSL